MNNFPIPNVFTSESVSEGHPDKIADQIADAILDSMLAQDPKTRICCEVFVTTNFVLVGGEFRSSANVNIEKIVRNVIDSIGYNDPEIEFSSKECEIEIRLHTQSADIVRGVDKAADEDQGAGDQGIIFGYATNETKAYLPYTYVLSNEILLRLREIRRNQLELMPYLRPDAKSQISLRYDAQGQPVEVQTVVVSTQHTNFLNEENAPHLSVEERENQMLKKIASDVRQHVLEKVIPAHLLTEETRVLINPTGKFVIGGPHGDAGLTNRKIVVDTYGGACSHGGGGMSGKDASKVDRSAAYMARYVAKNLVAAGLADRLAIQLAYAIGINRPVAIFVNTFGTAQVHLGDGAIAELLLENLDFSPNGIERKLSLQQPKYFVTASYGHMSREPYTAPGHYWSGGIPEDASQHIDFFSWERLDLVDQFKNMLKPYL